MKQPREIIAAHKSVIALDKLADDLNDMKKEIEESAKQICLEGVKKTKSVTKINMIQLDYETGREIKERLISYFDLKKDTTEKEIAQMLSGLLDLVKLQSYIHRKDLNKWSTLSNVRHTIWWYSIKEHLYCHLQAMEPDDLKKVLEKEVG